MALDGITVSAVVKELSGLLTGARISKIAQPENASNYEKLMEMTQNLHELEENLQKLYVDWEEYTNALEAQESQMEG